MGIFYSMCESKKNMEALLDSPNIHSQLKPLLDVMCEEKPDDFCTEQDIFGMEYGGSAIACREREGPYKHNRIRKGHKDPGDRVSTWAQKENIMIECGGRLESICLDREVPDGGNRCRTEQQKTEPKLITWESKETIPLPVDGEDAFSFPVSQKGVAAFHGIPHVTLESLYFTPHENPQLFGIDYRASIYSWRRETDGRYYINYESAPYVLSLILEKQPIECIDEKVRLYIADQIIASVSAFQNKGRVFASSIGLDNVGITREGKVLLIDFDAAAEAARMEFIFYSNILPIPCIPDYVDQARSNEQRRKLEGHEVYKLAVLLGTILTGMSFAREVRRLGPKAYLDEFDESEVPRTLRRLLVKALGKRAARPDVLEFLGSVNSDPKAQELLKDTLDSLLYDSSDPDVILTRENEVELQLEKCEMMKKGRSLELLA